MYRRYWTISGSSNPYFSVMAARSAGGTGWPGPTSDCTGSPGSAYTARKIRKVVPSSTGIM